MRVLAGVLTLAIAPAMFGAAPPRTATIRVDARNGSHERGTAILTRRGDEVTIDVRMTGLMPDSPTQLVHLHSGSCDRLSLRGAIDLEPLAAGRSLTTLRGRDVKRAFGTATAYFVSVHEMLANRSQHVACGGPTPKI